MGGLPWNTNGNCRHGIFFGDNRYTWEARRHGTSGGSSKILALRTTGMHPNALHKVLHPICVSIKTYYRQFPCVWCGSTSYMVTDHKNDLYNDPCVLDCKTQTRDDFQSSCTHCNLQKSHENIIVLVHSGGTNRIWRVR